MKYIIDAEQRQVEIGLPNGQTAFKYARLNLSRLKWRPSRGIIRDLPVEPWV